MKTSTSATDVSFKGTRLQWHYILWCEECKSSSSPTGPQVLTCHAVTLSLPKCTTKLVRPSDLSQSQPSRKLVFHPRFKSEQKRNGKAHSDSRNGQPTFIQGYPVNAQSAHSHRRAAGANHDIEEMYVSRPSRPPHGSHADLPCPHTVRIRAHKQCHSLR